MFFLYVAVVWWCRQRPFLVPDNQSLARPQGTFVVQVVVDFQLVYDFPDVHALGICDRPGDIPDCFARGHNMDGSRIIGDGFRINLWRGATDVQPDSEGASPARTTWNLGLRLGSVCPLTNRLLP